MNVILENIYLEDTIHALKMLGGNILRCEKSYSVDSKNRKYEKKHTSLLADAETFKQHDANGPPDKAKDMKTAKRAQRRGKVVINSMVEVEYKEKMKMENSVIWDG